MTPFVENLNLVLSLGTVVLLLSTALLIFDFYTSKSLQKLVSRYGHIAAFLLITLSSLMTLVYSEILGFLPCGLCWFERIFLYPQAFLLGAALYTKDKAFMLYGVVLSVPGLIVALYHHYIQMGGSEVIACPSSGGDCGQRIIYEFGFVTFPLMAVAVFAFLIVLYVYMMKAQKNS